MQRLVDKLKGNGQVWAAGVLAAASGLDRQYGCHFGMRSTLEYDRELFYKGWDEAHKEMTK